MAIFNKPDQQTNIQTNSTIISSSTKIEGTITSKCALHIDGTHEGIINANGTANAMSQRSLFRIIIGIDE